MRTDAAQLGSHKAVHKVQTAVQPCKELVFDFVMDRERDLGALRPDLSEINDAHHGNVSAYGLERILAGRIAVHRQQHGVRFKPERTAEAEIDSLGGCHGCAWHDQKLPPI